MASTSSSCPIHGLRPRTRGWSVFSPRLASTGTLAGGGVCTWRGWEGALSWLLWWGGEAHPSISVITCFWEPGHKVQMASMLLQHDQGRGLWILLHVVSGPWTSFVAALDKGQCRKAVCRRYTANASPLGILKKSGKIYFGFWLISFCLPKTGFSRIFAGGKWKRGRTTFADLKNQIWKATVTAICGKSLRFFRW